MDFKKIPCSDRYIYGAPTPLPPSPQLPPGSATATTKRGAALLEVKTTIFLHNLHKTDKSLVPSGGNALVLNKRKGRRDVSCKSERYAQRTNQKKKDQFHVGHEVIWRTLQNHSDLTNSSCSEQQILVFFLQIIEHKDKTNLAKVRRL